VKVEGRMGRWERVVRRCVYRSLSARCERCLRTAGRCLRTAGRCLRTVGRRDKIPDLVQSTARWTALRGGWAGYRLVICASVAVATLPLAKERDVTRVLSESIVGGELEVSLRSLQEDTLGPLFIEAECPC
jgi:hypothetical protein